MDLQRGMRDKLDKYINVNSIIDVNMSMNGSDTYDFCCFGVDSSDNLSDDRYMIFYNQTVSPNGEIQYSSSGNSANFKINLSALPVSINKLVFTVSIDGNTTMGNIVSHTFGINQNGSNLLSLQLNGSDFDKEKAIITVEIYKKDVWRINAIARGFNGGLGDLLKSYGGEEETSAPQPAPAPAPQPAPVQTVAPAPQPAPVQTVAPAPQPAPAPQQQQFVNPFAKLSSKPQNVMMSAAPQPVQSQIIDDDDDELITQTAPQPQKQFVNPFAKLSSNPQNISSAPTPQPAPVQQKPAKVSLEKKMEKAPQLVSLVKPLKVELEKRNLLDTTARVALVMDISGSMSGRYGNGTVQEVVNKVLPLAVQFDDDGELDFWYYGSNPKRMQAVTLDNYASAVPKDWRGLMRELGYGNNEPKVMDLVCAEYKNTTVPAYVIFVTDGGVGSSAKISKILQDSSTKPIFWQFVGIGGSNYGILEKFDDMPGRYVDNADFFAIDDFRTVPNSELYSRLLNEFPQWLTEIKHKNMI